MQTFEFLKRLPDNQRRCKGLDASIATAKRTRSVRGATLALGASIAICTIMIVIGFILLCTIIGGTHELEIASQSGNLNVAKEAAVKVAVPLQRGEEQQNFGSTDQPNRGCLDEQDGIDLLTYNRVIAQSMLVSMNAAAEGGQCRDATGSVSPIEHAKIVADTAQSGSNSLGVRLTRLLSSSSQVDPFFGKLAQGQSVRLLNNQGLDASKTKLVANAFISGGTSTNVYLDPTILPAPFNRSQPSTMFGNDQKTAKLSYANKTAQFLSGYTTLPGNSLYGVPVFPYEQPHLVSRTTASGALRSPSARNAVPPNTFLNRAAAAARISGGHVIVDSSAVVGALNKSFEAAIPRGYIVLHNWPGQSFTDKRSTGASIFNNELMQGIVYDPRSGIFTTNQKQYKAWLAYNKNPVGPQPPSDQLHSTVDNPVNPTKISNSSPSLITWLNVHARKFASALPIIKETYAYADGGDDSPLANLDQVEYFKVYFLSKIRGPLDPSDTITVKAPPGQTGLKLAQDGAGALTYTEHYTAPAPYGKYPYDFGTIGTPLQLLRQVDHCNGGSPFPARSSDDSTWIQTNEILAAILQRANEIKPGTTMNDLVGLLNSKPLPLGSDLYIYMADGKHLTITQTPPPWKTATTVDGLVPHKSGGYWPPLVYSQTYDIMKTMVDAEGNNSPAVGSKPNGHDGDGRYHRVPFKVAPAGVGHDVSAWTPSSGYQNLLGQVDFLQQAEGGGQFSIPN